MTNKNRTSQYLLGFGALLFFLGLLSGFAIPAMTNPRMGLSGHLEGVMNGTFLIVIGLAWSRLHLAPGYQAIAFWLLLYGTFANWLFVTFAAMFGTKAMTPIASSGHEGQAWQEALVAGGLFSVGIAMVLGCGLLVWGFFRKVNELD
ncbi:MAG: hydrogenase [Gammaproteobacteria bacterium]|nr:MAG: hydrogenase [Gammaproteobacteria bacterium]RLA53203.1 MAG: hydrogenase [Gammaproteobacteria bacterium]